MDDLNPKSPLGGKPATDTMIGYAGLALFAGSFATDLVADPHLTRATGLLLGGWGFLLASGRGFQTRIAYGYHLRRPAWRLKPSSAVYALCAIGGAGWLIQQTLL